jgi:hypothetical protein
MDNYYTELECTTAIATATEVINNRTKECLEYTRGYNDCAALVAEYDRALRGPQTKIDYDFTWKNPRQFLVGLRRKGFTLEEYFEHCDYKIIRNGRPKVGDVAFSNGAFLASQRGWVSTTETNEGVVVAKQLMYLERNMSVIARPQRNNT